MNQKIDEIRVKLVSINKDINEIQQNQQKSQNSYLTNSNPTINKLNKKKITAHIPLNPNSLNFRIKSQNINQHILYPAKTPRFKTITDLDLFSNQENQLKSLNKRYATNKNSELMADSILNLTQSNSSQKTKNNQNKLYFPEKMSINNHKFLKTIIQKHKLRKKKTGHLCTNKIKINATFSERLKNFADSKNEVFKNKLNRNNLDKNLKKNRSIFCIVKRNKEIYSSENNFDDENNNLNEINNNNTNNIINNDKNNDTFIPHTNKKFVIPKNEDLHSKTNIISLNSNFSRNRKNNNNKSQIIRDNKSNGSKDIRKKSLSIFYNNLINNNNTCNLVIKTRPKIKYINCEKNKENYENLINELIEINNNNYKNEAMDEHNIIDKYKAILNENMIYKNFIQKLFKLQTNSNGASQMKNQKIEENNEKSSINMLYNWIKRMSVNEKNSEENIDN